MKPAVYIDGKDGTTGLQIYDRLAARRDLELLVIDEKKRMGLRFSGALPRPSLSHRRESAGSQSRMPRHRVHQPDLSPCLHGAAA